MFGFLSPLALVGLALLSVPILVHLFKPRKVRRIPFSSLRWLRASQQRMSRRVRLHQWLLFLLRVGLLALLVFALAKPVLTLGRRGGAAERFIVLDVSRSMNYGGRDSDGESMEAGKRIARQLASHLAASDRTAVLLAGAQPRSLTPLVTNTGPYLSDLENVRAESGDARLTDALAAVQPMIGQPRADAALELFLITDNDAGNWSQEQIARFVGQFEKPPRVTIVDVGPAHPVNGWIADARFIAGEGATPSVLRVTLGAAGPQVQQRLVRLENLAGLPAQTQQVELTPGRAASVNFELPANVATAGQVARLALEPGDAMPDDDAYWLNLDATAWPRVVVIEPASTEIEDLQPGHHLRTALAVLPIAAPGRLQVQRVPPAEVLGPQLQAADLVVMVDVPVLTDSAVEALEQYVQNGGTLAVFLGPSVDRNFYNSRMADPLRASQALLPMSLGEPFQVGGADLPRLSNIDRSNPLLADLADPIHDSLSDVQVRGYFRMEPVTADGVTVLATIGRQTPGIVERRLGLGRVVLFNTTANDAWSDLPRRPSFITLIDRMLGEKRAGTFTLSEAIHLPLIDVAEETQVAVTTPDGQTIQPPVSRVAGRAVLELGVVEQPGIYRVAYDTAAGRSDFPIVVQPARGDSMFARADESTLQAWWQPAEVRIVRPDAATGTLDLGESRVIFEPWLIAVACFVLLGEMYLVHRLCPTMTAAVKSHA